MAPGYRGPWERVGVRPQGTRIQGAQWDALVSVVCRGCGGTAFLGTVATWAVLCSLPSLAATRGLVVGGLFRYRTLWP